jgi:PAS domain S-box-containing protein
MAVIRLNGRIDRVNAALCAMVGRDEAALRACCLDELVPADQRASFWRHLDAFTKKRCDSNQFTIDVLIRGRDRLHGLLVLSPLFGQDGSIACLLVHILDIGELLRPKHEQEEIYQCFKALSDATFEAVLISQNGICLDANHSAAEMLGMLQDDIIGVYVPDLFAPEFRQTVRDKLYTGCETAYRAVARKKGGIRFHVMIQGKTVSIGSSQVHVSVMRDIDTQVRTEAALRESEHHLRSFLESASNFVLFRFRHNPDNPCKPHQVFISPSIEEIIDRDRVYDFQSFLGTLHPDDRKRMQEAMQNMRNSRRMDIRVRIEDRSGKGWRWLHIIVLVASDLAGNDAFYNGIILDITGEMAATTALKKREGELKERTESLSEANIALEVLLRKREVDRMEVEEKILTNARSLILPYLDKLKASRLDDRQRIYLNLVESNLNEIISPLTQRMSRHYMNFTPMEIQVANLVKEGKTTKDIAFILGLSIRTIEAVRYGIRRKLGLKKKRINLRSYLLSIDGVQSVASTRHLR